MARSYGRDMLSLPGGPLLSCTALSGRAAEAVRSTLGQFKAGSNLAAEASWSRLAPVQGASVCIGLADLEAEDQVPYKVVVAVGSPGALGADARYAQHIDLHTCFCLE